MHAHVHGLPIIEPGALERTIVDGESERLHEMQRAAGCGAQSRDVAGIRGNLGLDEHDVQGRVRRRIGA